MIPEYNIFWEKLFFNGEESLYKPVEDESEDEFATDDGRMRMRFRRPIAEYYVNLVEGKKIRAQELFGKKYLVEDSLSILPWKLLSGSKTINGYQCREASYYDNDRKQHIVAWYTDKLKPFLGPENFNSLPGTVLQVDINNGERTITAIEISLDALRKNDIKVPASGHRTSEAEFRELMENQMKRMGAEGGRIIRRN